MPHFKIDQRAFAALTFLLCLTHSAAADPLVSTYSIVARDPATGSFGVAVQSHWFQVGAGVPWAAAGIGAVATQSFIRVDYGPKGLDLMAEGKSAQEALDLLVQADSNRSGRQVAMVDSKGETANWTGSDCIDAAGHYSGKGYAVQANMMDRPTVWPAMAKAYEQDLSEDFAERLLRALEAAEREGGDIRGRQSAALLVVRGESTGNSWEDRLIDLRVDDHPEPLRELRRLLQLHRAYDAMNLGDEAFASGEVDKALAHYSRGAELAPEVTELPFWKAVTLVAAGRDKEALPIFQLVFATDPRWTRLVPRLPASGLLPDDAERIEKILATAPPAQ